MMTENDFEPKFKDEQLLAYLDGEAGPEVASEIERSPADRERARELARMHHRLASRLYRLECPESETLGEYHLGFLGPAQAKALQAHLDECLRCSRELAQLRAFIGETAPGTGRQVQAAASVLLARLVSGLGGLASPTPLSPAFAVRGQKQGIAVYEADGFRVTVEAREDRAHPGKKSLVGLVTGPQTRSFRVALRSTAAEIAEDEVDELGNFVLAGIDPGEYDIEISSSFVTIHIPGYEVK